MKKSLIFVLTILLTLAFTTGLFAKIQVGEAVNQKLETPHPYNGKGLVWEQEISWPGAGYIAIHFSQFDLAPGDYVEISDPAGDYVYTYKEKGKVVRGGEAVLSEFWATYIPADTAVVRLYSNNRKGANGFVIDKWVRGYEKGFINAILADTSEEFDASIEAICSSDDKEWAKCYEGTDMYNKSKAVSRLLIGGMYACTGWLVGSEGHLMTNNHCIENQTDADNTNYEFMAEGSTCNTDCSSWGDCPGVVAATSGNLVKTNTSLDYSLILLPTNLTGTYGYMQLRSTLPTIGERIYIPQHPGHKGKQLSVLSDVDGPYSKIYSTDEAPCSGGPGDIGYYADTEGGSSGSPVLGYTDNLVVSLHHCALCPNRGVPIPSIIADLGGLLPADAVSGGTGPMPPAAPSNLSGKAGKDYVNLTWSDNSSNEDGFKIYRGLTSGSLSLIATVGANTTGYSDSGLTRKTYYYYQVCAYNTEGDSCTSVVSVRTK